MLNVTPKLRWFLYGHFAFWEVTNPMYYQWYTPIAIHRKISSLKWIYFTELTTMSAYESVTKAIGMQGFITTSKYTIPCKNLHQTNLPKRIPKVNLKLDIKPIEHQRNNKRTWPKPCGIELAHWLVRKNLQWIGSYPPHMTVRKQGWIAYDLWWELPPCLLDELLDFVSAAEGGFERSGLTQEGE